MVAKARFAIALDIGTSKIEGALVDLVTLKTVAFSTLFNSQRVFGPDVITRLNLAISKKPGLASLHKAVADSIEILLYSLIRDAHIYEHQVSRILAVGNSAMHHLLLGINPRALARAPFIPSYINRIYRARAKDIGFKICREAPFEFLPNIGGFVGSDAIAVIVACGIYKSSRPALAIDAGTNGEVILGDKNRILVASTSAGPAFEGWHISCGMGAQDGAIESVSFKGGKVSYETIGDSRPKGVCGSGLIDLIKGLLGADLIERSGKFKDKKFRICGDISITQDDIREVQVAKAAIQAAVKILKEKFGGRTLNKVFLTGRFGSRISKANAREIGLIPKDIGLKKVEILEHGALDGAKLILSSNAIRRETLDLYKRITHIELHKEKNFQDEFVDAMRF